MPLPPVISQITSLQAWKVGQPQGFKPSAVPTPASWASDALPDGITLDSTTGKISGIPTKAGVSVVTLQALAASWTIATSGATIAGDSTVEVADTSQMNVGDLVSGTGVPTGAKIKSITDATHFVLNLPSSAGIMSAASLTITPNAFLTFPIAIEESAVVLGSAVQLNWDWDTGNVTSPSVPSAPAAQSAAQAAGPALTLYGQPAAPLVYCNLGDTVLINVAAQKSGANQDVAAVSLVLAGKESEDAQAPCVVNDGNFLEVGAGSSALYQILVFFDPSLLEAALENVGVEYLNTGIGIQVNNVLYVVAELRMGIQQAPLTGGDPVIVYRTSRKFLIAVEQGLANP